MLCMNEYAVPNLKNKCYAMKKILQAISYCDVVSDYLITAANILGPVLL